MGLLSLGTPLDWHESKKYNEHVRNNGIIQLINIFKQHKSRDNDLFYWGDEVEYMLVKINEIEKRACLSIDCDYILYDLNAEEKSLHKATENNISFHPEYGRYMIEATPAKPYDGNSLDDYLYVEQNMMKRRDISQGELPDNVRPLTITSFPRMGCGNFTSLPSKPIGPASQSLFLPDEIINRHVRFPTLTANIRKRRGSKVAINLPLYPDVYTKLLDDSIVKRDLFKSDEEPFIGAAEPGHVYMDSMGFGMGSSCLQVTVQAKNIVEARYLYDSLASITPIMLSLTAAAPIFKGYLVNQDVRWNVISGAVDDRTFIERAVHPYPHYNPFGGLDIDKADINKTDYTVNSYGDYKNMKTRDGKPIQKIPKSRYDSIDSYLGDTDYGTSYFKESYNDLRSPINKKVYDTLLNTGNFDPILAQHFAHLFIRDPLVIFSERINQDNELENDHFENIQSTNWQTLRFKPPALYRPEEDLLTTPGWRVEFRPMEIQLTDFENAAYAVFIVLVSKAILKFKPDFYIPILKIDENMGTAHRVDSVKTESFWFKSYSHCNLKNNEFIGYDLSWFDRYLSEGNDALDHDKVYINGYLNGSDSSNKPSCNELLYSINDVINGNESFPGLLRLVIKFVATELTPHDHTCHSKLLAEKLLRIKSYLMVISQRASGKIPTTARWIRDKVLSSPHYSQDSKVNEKLNYDLMKDAAALSECLDVELHNSLLGEEITDYLYKN
ncbi:uncharacterized protein PRCAT00001519001 [Priceomyces carsonii]|uniref:uncharacterized protein n=1 Tax=Priceomyces carsonii TaxID=28549 RepID=UPI002EDA7D7D|nr:unnamed protein product [Priceomyces carsonii]